MRNLLPQDGSQKGLCIPEALQSGEHSEVLRPVCSGTPEQPRGAFYVEELGIPSLGLTLVGSESAS